MKSNGKSFTLKERNHHHFQKVPDMQGQQATMISGLCIII